MTGRAGSGKTGCVVEIVEGLRERGLPVLAFRLDRVLSVSTTTDLGCHLNLEESPVPGTRGGGRSRRVPWRSDRRSVGRGEHHVRQEFQRVRSRRAAVSRGARYALAGHDSYHRCLSGIRLGERFAPTAAHARFARAGLKSPSSRSTRSKRFWPAPVSIRRCFGRASWSSCGFHRICPSFLKPASRRRVRPHSTGVVARPGANR